MAKDRRVRSLSFDRSMVSPFACSSRGAKRCRPENPPLGLGFGSADDVKEWEDARCPICMEHPHNAVLLRCFSFEKGCRPFMCNTSYRHSNCLDQFSKSSVSSPSTAMLQEIPFGNMTYASHSQRDPSALYDPTEGGSDDSQPKLLCPLCRGEVYGWTVVQPAREFMNNKARCCSSETCDFSGTYSELRKHARSDHPLTRPTEVDPERQRDWTRFEHDRDYEDVLSSIRPILGEESNGESISDDFRAFLTLNFAFLTIALEVINSSRDTEEVPFRRRSGGGRRFRYDQESDRGTTENSHPIPERAFYGRHNNPSPVDRFQGRQHSSQSRLHWRHSRAPSERVAQGRNQQSSQTGRAYRHSSHGLRWRTPRWSSSDNGQ